jgi:prepilin-type N-terminal cleavage/methylation domain-containing protein
VKKGRFATGGFTLIELMIVVAIIGILTAIIIPNYQYNVIRGFNAAAMADLRNFKINMESAYVDSHVYPTF